MKVIKCFVLITMIVLMGTTGVSHSMGLFPDPTPTPSPTPVPTPTPTPPPSSLTTEYGEKVVYPSETLYYFDKKTSEYGTFTLTTVDAYGKETKYTITNSFMNNILEVRDSQSRGIMVAILPPGYDKYRVYIKYTSGSTPAPTPPPDATIPLGDWNHVNQESFCENEPKENCSVSIIMCKNDLNYKEAYLNGVKMREHGNPTENCNRQTFTNKTWQGKVPHNIDGEIILVKRDGSKVRVPIYKNTSLWDKKAQGKCFIMCGK